MLETLSSLPRARSGSWAPTFLGLVSMISLYAMFRGEGSSLYMGLYHWGPLQALAAPAPKPVLSPGSGDWEEGGHPQAVGLDSHTSAPSCSHSPKTPALRALALECQRTSVPTVSCHREHGQVRESGL